MVEGGLPAGPGEGVNFGTLREENRAEFLELLASFGEGGTALVWEPRLMKPFNALLSGKELAAQKISILRLEKGGLGAKARIPAPHVAFLLSPDVALLELVEEWRQRLDQAQTLHLIFTPKSSVSEGGGLPSPTAQTDLSAQVVCEQRLEELGLRSRLASLSVFPLHFFLQSPDLVSMNRPDILPQLASRTHSALLHDVVTGLAHLESVFGPIPSLYYKGEWSRQIHTLLLNQRQQTALSKPKGSKAEAEKAGSSQIQALVLMDRWTDPLTPLVTQLTYEGLVDELYGIRLQETQMPAEKFAKDEAEAAEAKGKTKTVLLSSADELYAQLRDLNLNGVGPALRANIAAIGQLEAQRHKASSIREYREFVRRLPELQAAKASASLHTSIAELLKAAVTKDFFLDSIQVEQEILNSVHGDKPIPFILDAMAQGVEMAKVLRLVCLHSVASDGLRQKTLDQYRAEAVESYGSGALAALVEVERAGLLCAQGHAAAVPLRFPAQRKALRLIVEDVDDAKPNDLAYTYSGYAPLSARLAQYWLSPGWAALAEVLGKVAGPTGLPPSSPPSALAPSEPPTVLFFFVGGITAAEVSALRFLGKKYAGSHNVLIGTTAQITGASLIDSIISTR